MNVNETASILEAFLDRFPSSIAKMVYLSSLWNFDSGIYEEPNLCSHLGKYEADRRIRLMHATIFEEWLMFGLPRECQEMERYLDSVERERPDALGRWMLAHTYRSIIPEARRRAERLLFLSDIEITLGIVVKRRSGTESDSQRAWDWRISQVLDWVEELRGGAGVSLKIAAARLRVSAQHLGRVFTNRIGRPFKSHLRSVRHRHALNLLRRPELSIKEIAAMLGYSDQSDFAADLRAAFGVSPTQYRAQLNSPGGAARWLSGAPPGSG